MDDDEREQRIAAVERERDEEAAGLEQRRARLADIDRELARLRAESGPRGRRKAKGKA